MLSQGRSCIARGHKARQRLHTPWEVCQNMDKLLLIVFVLILHGYWIYKVATYDWSKFEEDSEGDDFLKPYE